MIASSKAPGASRCNRCWKPTASRFVGRETSGAVAGFTKRQHEGHCGAVVAAPGLFGDGHEYSSGLNYLQYIVPQALTNAIPDVMLILIGANWTQIGYDDSGWSNGVARLGCGDSVAATTVSYGPQSNNKYVTLRFEFSDFGLWRIRCF